MELLPQRRPRPSVWLCAGVLLLTSAAPGQTASSTRKTADGPSESRARASITRIHFEPSVETGGFVALGGAYSLSLQSDGSTVVVPAAPIRTGGGGAPPRQESRGSSFPARRRRAMAAGRAASVSCPDEATTSSGTTPAAWRRDVPHFESVLYRQVYPGVDLVYYGRGAEVEHDFLVQPGADPATIRLRIEGAGPFAWRLPATSWPRFQGGRFAIARPSPIRKPEAGDEPVEATYALRERGEIGIRLAAYDRSRPLVIDPVLSYSSYLGGSGQDDGQSVAVAPDKTLWVVGNTQSANMPGAVNAPGGGQDVFVSHLTSDGGTLLSTTYVGGSSVDFGNRLVVASTGKVYVVGSTISPNFPGIPGGCTFCRQPPAGLTGLSDLRSHRRRASGAHEAERRPVRSSTRRSMAETAREHAWVLGQDGGGGLHSGGDSTSDDFPTSVGAFQVARVPAAVPADPNNETDVTVTRFVGLGHGLLHLPCDLSRGLRRRLRGRPRRGCRGARLRDRGHLLRFVPPHSQRDPAVPGRGFRRVPDAFVHATGRPSTTRRSSGDRPTTTPSTWPSTPTATPTSPARPTPPTSPRPRAPFSATPPAAATPSSPSCRGTAEPSPSPRAWRAAARTCPSPIALDPAGNAYVTGHTTSTNFPTPKAVQAMNAGADDVFVTKLASDGASLRWSTYLGGGGFDHGTRPCSRWRSWGSGSSGSAAAGFPTRRDAGPGELRRRGRRLPRPIRRKR